MSNYTSNIQYKNQFNKDNYDECKVMLPKGHKAELKAIAKEQGKSLNAYIIEAIKEKRERDELAQSSDATHQRS